MCTLQGKLFSNLILDSVFIDYTSLSNTSHLPSHIRVCLDFQYGVRNQDGHWNWRVYCTVYSSLFCLLFSNTA